MRTDWEIKGFDACIEKQKAPTKLLSSSYKEEGLYPIVSQEKDLISGFWDNPDDLFHHTKPVVVFGDHTMVVKYIDFDFVVGADGVKILEPKGFLLPKFFFYWVSSVHIKSRGYARHFRYLREANVPVPALPEQQRIVGILDQEFAKIDALKANAEKSLQAAKDLFQATLKKELEPKEGWKTACLDDICRIVGRIGFRGYTRNDIVSSPENGAISLSPSNIVEGEMKYDKLTYISWFKYDESPEIKIYNGDILLVKTGSSYGKSAIIRDLPHEATINPQLVVLKNIKIDTQYLHFFLSTDNARKKFDEFVSGTAIPTFSQRNLGQMAICFPNPKMTKEIVAKLNNLRERLIAFQENYQKTLSLCDDLKQALLRKAFNGEL